MNYLDKFILLICCAVEVYMIFEFYDNYFDIRNKLKNILNIIWISCLITIMLFSINIIGNAYVNLFSFPIIMWIYVSILFNSSLGNRLIYFIFSFSIFLGCEYLFGVLLEIPFGFKVNKSAVNLADMPWQMLTMKLLAYILFAVAKQIVGKAKRHMSGKIFIMYLCLPVASLGMMLLLYYSEMEFLEYPVIKVMISFFFAHMLVGNILIFYIFNRYSEAVYDSMKQKLVIFQQEMDLNYYTQLAIMNKKHEEFIHNTSHYLKVIGELARQNRNENIINIINELDVEFGNNELTVYSGNHVLNAILIEKKGVAEKKNIEFDVYIEPGTHVGRVSDIDLITMLENLLDNAICATEKCEEDRKVQVRIFMQNKGSFCVVNIVNGFIGEVRYNKGFVSTKMDDGIHGIGIKNVEKIAEKYDGYLECFTENNLFTADLLLSVL